MAETLRLLLPNLALVLLVVSQPALVNAQEVAPAEASEAPAPAEDTGYFFWTDSSLSLLPYGDGYVVDPDEQSTLTFEHAHASKLGDLFMFVDFTKFHGDSAADDSTWYGEFGPRLSFGKLLGKDLSYTLFKRSLFEIKDVLVATAYERGEDADVAEAVLLGVGLRPRRAGGRDPGSPWQVQFRAAELLRPRRVDRRHRRRLQRHADHAGRRLPVRDWQQPVPGRRLFRLGARPRSTRAGTSTSTRR